MKVQINTQKLTTKTSSYSGFFPPSPLKAVHPRALHFPKKIIRSTHQVHKVTQAILALCEPYMLGSLYKTESFQNLEQKIRHFVKNGERIEFFLIGFPFKSNAKDQTTSPLPDMAERSAFVYLNKLLTRIGQTYYEGARLTLICSGYATADVLGIQGQHVADYERALCQIASDIPTMRILTSHHLNNGRGSKENLRLMIDQMSVCEKAFEKALNNPEILKSYAAALDHKKGQHLIEHYGLETMIKKAITQNLRFETYIKTHITPKNHSIFLSSYDENTAEKVAIKLTENASVMPWQGFLMVDHDGASSIRPTRDVDLEAFALTSEAINGVWCPYYTAK